MRWYKKENFIGKTIIKMSLKFNSHKDYILIQSTSGIDYFEIVEGISKLISLPEFKNKKDIWIFESGIVNIAYSDLNKIKLLVEKICPRFSKKARTALVVKNDFQQAVCMLYSDICKDLNQDIRVFTNFESAKDWIIR